MWHANTRLRVLALRMLRSVKCLQKSSKLDHAGCSSLARDLNLEAGDKWIGRKKNAHISWYPGPNHEFLSPNELLESILQPGLVHLDGHVFTPRILQCPSPLPSFSVFHEISPTDSPYYVLYNFAVPCARLFSFGRTKCYTRCRCLVKFHSGHLHRYWT